MEAFSGATATATAASATAVAVAVGEGTEGEAKAEGGAAEEGAAAEGEGAAAGATKDNLLSKRPYGNRKVVADSCRPKSHDNAAFHIMSPIVGF